MEFREGMIVAQRMCIDHTECANCCLDVAKCPFASLTRSDDIDMAVKAVEDWDKKHRPKTMLEIAKERFPEVKWNRDNNTPDFCPYLLFGEFGYKGVVCSKTKCYECWSRIAPDQYQNGGK